MSFETYRFAQQLELMDYPFEALIMAAMRTAIKTRDGALVDRLKENFPDYWEELIARGLTPRGRFDYES